MRKRLSAEACERIYRNVAAYKRLHELSRARESYWRHIVAAADGDKERVLNRLAAEWVERRGRV